MSELTVRAFFPSGKAAATAAYRPVIGAAKAAAKGLPSKAVPAFQTAMGGALDQVMALPLAGILSSPWTSIIEVAAALKATAGDPNATELVNLVDHGLTSAHRPKVDLIWAGKSVARLEVGMDLVLDLIGVALEIRGGKIVGVKAGHCQGVGLMTLLDQPVLKHDGKSHALAGRLTFNKA